MKQVCFTFFISLFFQHVFAQSDKTLEFVGTLQLSNKQFITYKISFKPQNTEEFTGTSLSDIYGQDRTKSTINGTFNVKQKRISFKETGNISTKSKAEESTFCYIAVTNARIKTVAGKTIIEGKFTGKFKNGQVCTNGSIFLIGTEYLEELSNKLLQKNNALHPDTLKQLKQKVSTLKERAEKNTLKANEVLQVSWSSKEIIIEIWDGEMEDQDEIALYINNKRILDRLVIKKEKKVLVIPFEETIGTIRIVGIHEGESAPCTANILLRDNYTETPIVAVLKKGETTQISIKKQ